MRPQSGPGFAARTPRRLLFGVPALVVLVVAVGLLVARQVYIVGDPTAGEVRGAVAHVIGDRCPSGIIVRGVENLGGAGLPEHMRAAREIVCRAQAHGDEYPQLALQEVFTSVNAAKAYGGGFRRGRTVVESDTLYGRAWARVRALLVDG